MTVTKKPLIVTVDQVLVDRIDKIKKDTKCSRSAVANDLFKLGLEAQGVKLEA